MVDNNAFFALKIHFIKVDAFVLPRGDSHNAAVALGNSGIQPLDTRKGLLYTRQIIRSQNIGYGDLLTSRGKRIVTFSAVHFKHRIVTVAVEIFRNVEHHAEYLTQDFILAPFSRRGYVKPPVPVSRSDTRVSFKLVTSAADDFIDYLAERLIIIGVNYFAHNYFVAVRKRIRLGENLSGKT